MNVRNILKKDGIRLYAAAFFIPFILGLFCLILRGMAPFGRANLIAIDAWGQYFPMLREMKRAFRSGSFGYSFSGALGFNLTAQSAYYTNSLFWIPLFLLPGELTPAQVDLTVVLRFAAASLSFAVLLSAGFGKSGRTVIPFSLAYAFSGYTLAFINQFMWMDAVVFLPLVILGLERLFDGKSICLYTVFLALTIFSNFYIAYSVCIFCVLWFLMLSAVKKTGFRLWLKTVLRFAAASLTAGAVNAAVLLPVIRALSATAASAVGFNGRLRVYHSLAQMLFMLLPFHRSSLAYEAPNIYFGFICFILSVFALAVGFKNKRITALAALQLFLFVSFNINILDFIWHGFHFPNQLPGRQSFLFIFTGLIMAYFGFGRLIAFVKGRTAGKRRAAAARALSSALCCVIIAETVLNASYIFLTDVRATNQNSILGRSAAMRTVSEKYCPDSDKNEFWRIEQLPPRYNGGQLYGYNGISHYSSTMSKACYDFFRQLGMGVYAKNVSTQYLPNPVLNALFGVKYIVAGADFSDGVCFRAGAADDLYVYENPAALPPGFVADSAVKQVDMGLSGFELANDIFKKAAGCGDVIAPYGSGFRLDAAEFEKGTDCLKRGGLVLTDIGRRSLSGEITAEKDGVLLFSFPAADITVFIDGEKAEVLKIASYLGGADISAGKHEIKVKF